MSSTLEPNLTSTVNIIANSGFETACIYYKVSFERFATLKEAITTEKFFLPTNELIAFHLELIPKDDSGRTVFSLVKFSNSNSPETQLNCTIVSDLLVENASFYSKSAIIHSVKDGQKIRIMAANRASILDEANGLLPGGILTFCCRITVEISTFSQKVVSTMACQKLDDKLQMTDNLRKLLSSGAYSDFVLTVDGRQFQVHRAILHAQSSYFAAMFCHPDLTLHTSVPISDIEADLFAELLQYLYTGAVPAVADLSKGIELLVAADRFQLDSLKSLIELKLSSKTMLTVESMFPLLIAADTYNAPTLKTKAVEFISERATTKDVLTGLFENKLFFGKNGEKNESKSMIAVIQDLMKTVKN